MFTLLAVFALVMTADPLEIVLKKADQAAISTRDGRVTVAIESQSGIGAATVRPGKAGWPKQLRFDLGLRGLEGCTITSGDLRVRSSLGSKTAEVLRQRDGRWEPVEFDKALAPTIKQVEGRILVDLPAAWLDPARKELSIEWIDFYRG